jgi:hypothetical protein
MARREASAHSEITTKRARERFDLIKVMLADRQTAHGLKSFQLNRRRLLAMEVPGA